MKFKRLMCSILVSVLVFSMFGCGKGEKDTDVGVDEDTGMPEKLTIFCHFNPNVAKLGNDYNVVYGFQLLEEATGCQVEWVLPYGGNNSTEEQFNLMLLSRDYPDVIVSTWAKKSGGIQKYEQDGVIINVTDLVEKYMPNFKKYGDENPKVKKQYTTIDGQIYYFPFIRKDAQLGVFCGPNIRMDWLEKLNLAVPNTPEELHNVLRAFKTKDPNGNGVADEIPMSGQSLKGIFGIEHLFWPFDVPIGLFVEDGKIKYGVMDERFEQALTFVSNLFAEGLIDLDFMLNDRTKLVGKITNNQVGFATDYQPSQIMSTMETKDPNFKFEGIPYLANKKGERKVFAGGVNEPSVTDISAVISTANKNPIGTAKWFDFIYSEAGTYMMNFGKEGVTYTMVDGYPKLTDKLLNNQEGLTKTDAFTKYIAAYNSFFPMFQDWRYYEQYLHESGKRAIDVWTKSMDTSGMVPNYLPFTDEERGVIAQIEEQINTYVEEYVSKTIIGKDTPQNLPVVREQIRKMGIDQLLDAYQAAYNRYINM